MAQMAALHLWRFEGEEKDGSLGRSRAAGIFDDAHLYPVSLHCCLNIACVHHGIAPGADGSSIQQSKQAALPVSNRKIGGKLLWYGWSSPVGGVGSGEQASIGSNDATIAVDDAALDMCIFGQLRCQTTIGVGSGFKDRYFL